VKQEINTYLFAGLEITCHPYQGEIDAVLGITRREVIIPYRHFWITYRSQLKGSSILEDETEGCSETSARNYNFSLRNIPQERRSHLFPGGSLKSRTHTQFRENQATVSNVKIGDRETPW